MKAFFLRIIAWHKKNNPGFLDRLNPGIESYDVLNFFTTNSLVIPNELIELYSLSNGSNIPFGDQYDLFHLFPGYYLMPFQEATHIYRLKKMDELWSPDWFPIFSNGGGDYYVIKCSKEEKFPIIGFLVGGIEPEIEYTNLPSMLKTIADCFDSGAFYMTDERYLEILIDKEVVISRSNNQGLPRWN
jgi:cell wall assembly regulator SMI1